MEHYPVMKISKEVPYALKWDDLLREKKQEVEQCVFIHLFNKYLRRNYQYNIPGTTLHAEDITLYHIKSLPSCSIHSSGKSRRNKNKWKLYLYGVLSLI